MRYIFAILSFAFCLEATAQQADQRLIYALKVEKFQKMKTGGIAMTIGGTIMTIAGISMISGSETTTVTNQYGQTTNQLDSKGATGVLLTAVGLPVAGGGIVLWSIGAKKGRKYQEKLNGLSLKLNSSPQMTGLAVRYKF